MNAIIIYQVSRINKAVDCYMTGEEPILKGKIDGTCIWSRIWGNGERVNEHSEEPILKGGK